MISAFNDNKHFTRIFISRFYFLRVEIIRDKDKNFRIRDFILSRFDTKQGVAELSTSVKERIYGTGELNVKLYTDGTKSNITTLFE